MGVFDIFSKRQKRARGEMPDVYTYEKLPNQLKVQIVHIVRDAFGQDYGDCAENLYGKVYDALCREYGRFNLRQDDQDQAGALFNYLLQESSIDLNMDVVEICFQAIDGFIRNDYDYRHNVAVKLSPDLAIAELNTRFKENGIGYQFESSTIIRVDSEFVHAEAVKPALTLLRQKGFAGANDEFLSAHEHYRHGRCKECLVDALKAFESTMKAICDQRNWTPTKLTASALIDCCVRNGLLTKSYDSQLGALQSLLASGVPTVRNNMGGHGQGAEVKVVPEHVARYALNLAASNILFLVESNAALGK